MTTRSARVKRKGWVLACVLCAACGSDAEAGTNFPVGASTLDAGSESDPLDITFQPAPGSFDDLFASVIAPRCSGQPGLCHNGQFPPNLSTPAVAYFELVLNPSLEKPTRLRVEPAHPERSVLIDKLRNRDVSTRMPLGAAPLEEKDLTALEAWISGGALREPGAAPPVKQNLPPRAPELGIFDSAGHRLDGGGPARVTVGTTVELRHSVQDFETPDSAIPFSGVRLEVSGGAGVMLDPKATGDRALGATVYDATPPQTPGDALNRVFVWTVPETLTLIDKAGAQTQVPASGQRFTMIAVYTDEANFLEVPVKLGYVRVGFAPDALEIE